MQKPLFGYVVAAVIGAAISIVVGYLVYAAPGEAVPFRYWISHPTRFDVFQWIATGIMVAGGFRYLASRR